MSRFLLRSTISAAVLVALSASAALGQADSTFALSNAAERAMPTIMAPPPAPVAELAPITIPAITDTRLAVRPINEDVAMVVRRRAAFSRPAVLMITGGALLVTGLLVGGDADSILIISGAAIGAYGLYLHLQSPNARLTR